MWRIPSLGGDGEEARTSASLEFSIPYEGDIAAFFPIQISFTSPDSVPGFQVCVCILLSFYEGAHFFFVSFVLDYYLFSFIFWTRLNLSNLLMTIAMLLFLLIEEWKWRIMKLCMVDLGI